MSMARDSLCLSPCILRHDRARNLFVVRPLLASRAEKRRECHGEMLTWADFSLSLSVSHQVAVAVGGSERRNITESRRCEATLVHEPRHE